MGERTSYQPGTFCWQELATTDAAVAKGFYGELLGWEADDRPLPGGGSYTMLSVGELHVGALFELGPEHRAQRIPGHWASYVSVDDVDDVTNRAIALGAEAVVQPFDVLRAGRMAILRDPIGAMISLWEPRGHIGARLVNQPGAFCWNELACPDPQRASAFYGELLGWSFEPGTDTGYWTINNRDARAGGIRTLSPAEAGSPGWLAYVVVAGVDEALSIAERGGGRTIVGAQDIAIGRFAVLADPQGAVLALFEGHTDP